MSNRVILLVEDEPILRRQMARVIRGEGYETAEASSAEEAMFILDRQAVSLVLTDRKMPNMDGDSLFVYLRTNYPRIPVAIITAYPEGLENLEIDGLLIKPFYEYQLRELILRLTDEKST